MTATALYGPLLARTISGHADQSLVVAGQARPQLRAQLDDISSRMQQAGVRPLRVEGRRLSIEQLTQFLSEQRLPLLDHLVSCVALGGISFQSFSGAVAPVALLIDNADLMPKATLEWLLRLLKAAGVLDLPLAAVGSAPEHGPLMSRAYRVYPDSCMMLRLHSLA